MTTTTTPEAITMTADGLNVPNHPIIPFIEGDGTGPDIWAASQFVFDAAVEKAYKGERSLQWHEVMAGDKSHDATGEWLPQATLDAFSKYLVGIKGPLTTPTGGGIRSLNVALRQILLELRVEGVLQRLPQQILFLALRQRHVQRSPVRREQRPVSDLVRSDEAERRRHRQRRDQETRQARVALYGVQEKISLQQICGDAERDRNQYIDPPIWLPVEPD